MAFSAFQYTGGELYPEHASQLVIDSPADLESLNLDVLAPGSRVIDCSSGDVWILSPSKEWGVLQNNVMYPVITKVPDVHVKVGDESVALACRASGNGLSFAWSTKASGADSFSSWGSGNPSVKESTVASTLDNTEIKVVATNAAGTSTTATGAHIYVDLDITDQPEDAEVNVGDNATVSVTATGVSLAYQWYVWDAEDEEWDEISGATSSSYTKSSVTADDYGTRFYCKVSAGSSANEQTEDTGEAMIIILPEITADPSDASVEEGADATFTVTATGVDITYQWQIASLNEDEETVWTDIEGATEATLTLEAVTLDDDGGQYRVVVTDAYGEDATSDPADLAVSAASEESGEGGDS